MTRAAPPGQPRVVAVMAAALVGARRGDRAIAPHWTQRLVDVERVERAPARLARLASGPA